MSKTWQANEARAQFGAFLEASVREGPQIVTKRGVETAVLLLIAEWRRFQKTAQGNLKVLLLAPRPRTEALAPPRARDGLRPTLELE